MLCESCCGPCTICTLSAIQMTHSTSSHEITWPILVQHYLSWVPCIIGFVLYLIKKESVLSSTDHPFRKDTETLGRLGRGTLESWRTLTDFFFSPLVPPSPLRFVKNFRNRTFIVHGKRETTLTFSTRVRVRIYFSRPILFGVTRRRRVGDEPWHLLPSRPKDTFRPTEERVREQSWTVRFYTTRYKLFTRGKTTR